MTGNLALCLSPGLVDMDGHLQGFAPAAKTGAADGGGSEIV